MTISELINYVGQENVMLQWLPECQIRAESGRHGTKITFGANVINTGELAAQALTGAQPQRTGLVLWLPTNKLPKFLLDKLTASPSPAVAVNTNVKT